MIKPAIFGGEIWKNKKNVVILHVKTKTCLRFQTYCLGIWCNGNTTDSGPVILGSSPSIPTTEGASNLIRGTCVFYLFSQQTFPTLRTISDHLGFQSEQHGRSHRKALGKGQTEKPFPHDKKDKHLRRCSECPAGNDYHSRFLHHISGFLQPDCIQIATALYRCHYNEKSGILLHFCKSPLSSRIQLELPTCLFIQLVAKSQGV